MIDVDFLQDVIQLLKRRLISEFTSQVIHAVLEPLLQVGIQFNIGNGERVVVRVILPSVTATPAIASR